MVLSATFAGYFHTYNIPLTILYTFLTTCWTKSREEMPIFAYGIKNIYLEMFSRFICFCSGYEKGKNIPTNM